MKRRRRDPLFDFRKLARGIRSSLRALDQRVVVDTGALRPSWDLDPLSKERSTWVDRADYEARYLPPVAAAYYAAFYDPPWLVPNCRCVVPSRAATKAAEAASRRHPCEGLLYVEPIDTVDDVYRALNRVIGWSHRVGTPTLRSRVEGLQVADWVQDAAERLGELTPFVRSCCDALRRQALRVP